MRKQLYAFGGVLALWYLASLLIGTRIIPWPHQAIQLMFTHGFELLEHAFASLLRIVSALVISFAIGVPLGLFLGINKRFDNLFSPIIYVLYPIPKIAFLPVFMSLFGLGDASKIVLMITIIVFQVILSTRDGMRLIPDSYQMLLSSYHATLGQTIRHLYIPAIMPHLLGGMRTSLGVAIATLFFSENYATFKGLGYFIMNAWTTFNYPLMFAGITTLSLVGYILFTLVDTLEARLTHK